MGPADVTSGVSAVLLDMELVRHVRPVPLPAALSPDRTRTWRPNVPREGRSERGDPPRRGAVRADLEEVFRAAYPRVVAVAARVLGSRDEAEDVAQEVFLAFGRSTVPAGEATGWLCVAAAHTALNHLRSGRRRTAREETVGAVGGPRGSHPTSQTPS